VSCNEIHRVPSRSVMIFTSCLSAVMPPEIAEIFFALQWSIFSFEVERCALILLKIQSQYSMLTSVLS